MSHRRMSHYRMPILEERGFVVLSRDNVVIEPDEWRSLEYVDWKSSGDTRFAPLASAYGDIECNAFWHFDPPKPDKDGIWIDSQVDAAPTIAAAAICLYATDQARATGRDQSPADTGRVGA